MNCQQCGLALDPQQVAQTGRCPRCGTPVAVGAPVQQTIPAGVYAQPMGSYPPPPVQSGYGAPPAFGPPAQGYPGGMMPPAPQKNRTALIAVISAVVVLVLIGGTLLAVSALSKKSSPPPQTQATQQTGSPTSAVTPTSSAPSGFQLFTSPENLYSVDYPSGWSPSQDQTDQEQETFNGPANQAALVDAFTPNAGVTPQSYITTVCSIVGGGATTEPTQVTIAGQSWTRLECDSSDGSNHTLAEAVSYKGKIYTFIFASDTASFLQNRDQFFSIMEQSFKFLS